MLTPGEHVSPIIYDKELSKEVVNILLGEFGSCKSDMGWGGLEEGVKRLEEKNRAIA